MNTWINIVALALALEGLTSCAPPVQNQNITSIPNQIDAMFNNGLTDDKQIADLQSQANYQAAASAAAQQMQDSIVEFLDCAGDGPGFDEVVMRTKSGKLVASFEDGFLTIIFPGTYMTTDASHCPFVVTQQLQFCDILGCR